MARIRFVKPEFFSDAKLLKVRPITRLFYIGLFTQSDREGRFLWDEDDLKVKLIPYDRATAKDCLQQLADIGRIMRYGSTGSYGMIINFLKHQYINPREPDSKIPPPPKNPIPVSYQSDTGIMDLGIRNKDKGISNIIHTRENASKKEESKPNPDVKKLLDFFHRAVKGVRGHDPVKENGGKIGKLLKKRLEGDRIAPERIERMIVWYLTRKKKYKDEKAVWHETYKHAPEMGVMLSDAFFSQLLTDEINALTYMADNYSNLEKVFEKSGGSVYEHRKEDISKMIKELAMSKRTVNNHEE